MGTDYEYPPVDLNELLANRQKPVAYEAINKMGSWYDLGVDLLDYDFMITRGARAKWFGGITLHKS